VKQANEWDLVADAIKRDGFAERFRGGEKSRERSALGYSLRGAAIAMRDGGVTLRRAANLGGAKMRSKVVNLRRRDQQQHRYADDADRKMREGRDRFGPG